MTNIEIENEKQLIDHLETGCKTPRQWRIGTEHEKFAFSTSDLSPLSYHGPKSIGAVLEGLSSNHPWKPVVEDGNIIALEGEDGDAITLEPGGQLELSGAAVADVHQTCREAHKHLRQVKEIAEPMGIGFLGMGYNPLWSRKDIPWMPKARYDIMRRYMPRVGSLGLDMMLGTATVQVNLDFRDEADMVKKFRLSLALQPLATALFANSPFSRGKPNGYLSYRSHIWLDTDPDRCGMLPFVFEDGMGFERYARYALDVPMYFVKRQGRYIDASGLSFRDFLAGKLSVLPGERPTIADWEDHLTTMFPEVRLKRFLEMRGADTGSWNSLCALPAFWVGLLYDADSLEAAWELVSHWTEEDRQQLRRDVPRHGLQAKTADGRLQDLAKSVLAIAESGLRRRGCFDDKGEDESIYLRRLWEIAQSGKTPAEDKLDRYYNSWKEKVAPLFLECAY